MKKNRISILLIVTLFISLIVGGQLTTMEINNKGESDAVTYKIGYLPITHALPIFEEKELLEKENEGIRIELQKFSSWSDLTDALHAGKIDGASELIELAMSAKAKGIDLKAVALGHRDGNVIVVNEKINSAQDMKGKVFAIPSTQSSHYILLIEELKKAGLSLNDVSITQLAPAEMPASLASGAIDGYCVAEPFGGQAITNHTGKVLARSDELWDDSICCGFVLRNDVIQKNPEAFKRLLAGYRKAGEKLDKKESIRIAKKYLGQDEKTLETSLKWIRYDHLSLTRSSYELLTKKVIEDGMIDNPPTYKEFVYKE